MMSKNIIMICLLLLCCFSCKNNIDKTIEYMTGKNTIIPVDRMSCWINDSLISDGSSINAKHKLVVFVDSMACSGCYLKNMSIWNDFIELEEVKDFKIFFIFAPPKININSLQNSFYMTGLTHPIYIDSSYCFLKNNPHIPKEPMYHTFLLDENNNIILVGNPLHNKKIEKLFLDILDEKFGEKEENL